MENPKLHGVLGALKGLKGGSGRWTAFCPIHEADGQGHNPSLSIKHDEKGTIWLNCFNGCDGKKIMMATGHNPSDCYMPRQQEVRQQITAEYDYFDPAGVFAFQIVRMEPGKNGKSKDFRQRRKDALTGKWTWSTTGITKYPYRLVEMLAADPEIPVVITEGEKGTDYVRAQWPDVPVVCNPGGAGRWLKSYGKYFKGRTVIVVPDADLPNPQTGKMIGNIHAKEICDNLLDHATEVYMFEPPGMKPKWGLDDWVKANKITLDRFEAYIEKLQPWSPTSQIETKQPLPHEMDEDGQVLSPVEAAKKLLATLGVKVVGRTKDKAKCYSTELQQAFTIDPFFKYEHGLLNIGPLFRQRVEINAGEDSDYALEDVRAAVAMVASVTGQDQGRQTGTGIYMDGDRAVAIDPNITLVAENGRVTPTKETPVAVDGHSVTLDGHRWMGETKDIIAAVEAAADPAVRKQYFNDIHKVFLQWGNIKYPDAELWIAAETIATLIQSAWDWKPRCGFGGPTQLGKSRMLQLLKDLSGGIGKIFTKTTMAGFCNTLGPNSISCFFEEFESDSHRKKISDLLLAANRKGDAAERTTSNKDQTTKNQHFNIWQWAAGTEHSMGKATEENRLVLYPFFKMSGKEAKRSPQENRELHCKAVALAMQSVVRAYQLTSIIWDSLAVEDQVREVENKLPGAGTYCAIHDMTDQQAVDWFHEQLDKLRGEIIKSTESDAERMLNTILGHIPYQADKNLEQFILGAASTAEHVLSKFNIRVKPWRQIVAMADYRKHKADFPEDFKECSFVFMACNSGSWVRAGALKGTEFSDVDANQLLLQLPGAFKGRASFGTNGHDKQHWGVYISLKSIRASAQSLDGEDIDIEGHDDEPTIPFPNKSQPTLFENGHDQLTEGL